MSFFDEQSEQSLVKATIVSKYFWQWAKIMIATQKKNQQKYGRDEKKLPILTCLLGLEDIKVAVSLRLF